MIIHKSLFSQEPFCPQIGCPYPPFLLKHHQEWLHQPQDSSISQQVAAKTRGIQVLQPTAMKIKEMCAYIQHSHSNKGKPFYRKFNTKEIKPLPMFQQDSGAQKQHQILREQEFEAEKQQIQLQALQILIFIIRSQSVKSMKLSRYYTYCFSLHLSVQPY